jgi:hypothetical protein
MWGITGMVDRVRMKRSETVIELNMSGGGKKVTGQRPGTQLCSGFDIECSRREVENWRLRA